MGESMRWIPAMLGMLLAVNGLASPARGLAAEKQRGKMTREWDECIAGASEQAKADAVMKAVEKRVRNKAEEEKSEEEARTQQDEGVRVKEEVMKAAMAERDRIVAGALGCTDGPVMQATAEKGVEAARVVTVLEREVAQCAGPVLIGEWQLVGGRKRKTVQVASQMSRPLDADRRKSLHGVVSKVQSLVGAANLG